MDTLCRVCIDKATKCTSLSAKIENSSNVSFFEFLNKCTSINACENDKLPPSLCSICTHSIKTFYSFVKLAEKSNIILRDACNNSIATKRFNREISYEEVAIINGKTEKESEDFNKEDSFHCQTSKSSTGSSVYILDLVKEEPCISERTSIVDLKNAELHESGKFHSYADHVGESLDESDETLSCVDGHLTKIDAERSESEDDVPISLLKTKLIKNEDETDVEKTKIEYENHIRNGHGSRNQGSSHESLKPQVRENTYKCIQCDIIYNNREEFRTHCRNHIYGDKHECNICGKKFARHQYLQHHLVIHEEKKKHECSICGKGFKHLSSRCRHLKIHSGEKPFECETCGKKFHLKEAYKRHLGVHLNIRHTCPQCGKGYKTKNTLLLHIDAHAGKKHKCDICSKKFSTKQGLNVHMENHKGQKHECNICEKKFARRSYLYNHLATHEEKKKYKCSICGKGFRHCSTRWSHMKIHNDEKRFECKTCGKKILYKGNYESHLRVHLNSSHGNPQCGKKMKKYLLSHEYVRKKPECEICGKKFSTKRYLNFHMESHNGITKKCGQCDKEFKNGDTLSRHMKWHKDPKPFRCENCGKSLARKYTYTRHLEICKPVGNSNDATVITEESDYYSKENKEIVVKMAERHVNHSIESTKVPIAQFYEVREFEEDNSELLNESR